MSGQLDPSDIDVTYLLDAEVYQAVDDLVDLADLQDREWCVKGGMGGNAYVLSLPSTVEFRDRGQAGAMAMEDAEVFEMLGLYDEIWQRHRDGNGNGKRRGYVEVPL